VEARLAAALELAEERPVRAERTDKYGCYNHHTGTMWVNCKHYE